MMNRRLLLTTTSALILVAALAFTPAAAKSGIELVVQRDFRQAVWQLAEDRDAGKISPDAARCFTGISFYELGEFAISLKRTAYFITRDYLHKLIDNPELEKFSFPYHRFQLGAIHFFEGRFDDAAELFKKIQTDKGISAADRVVFALWERTCLVTTDQLDIKELTQVEGFSFDDYRMASEAAFLAAWMGNIDLAREIMKDKLTWPKDFASRRNSLYLAAVFGQSDKLMDFYRHLDLKQPYDYYKYEKDGPELPLYDMPIYAIMPRIYFLVGEGEMGQCQVASLDEKYRDVYERYSAKLLWRMDRSDDLISRFVGTENVRVLPYLGWAYFATGNKSGARSVWTRVQNHQTDEARKAVKVELEAKAELLGLLYDMKPSEAKRLKDLDNAYRKRVDDISLNLLRHATKQQFLIFADRIDALQILEKGDRGGYSEKYIYNFSLDKQSDLKNYGPRLLIEKALAYYFLPVNNWGFAYSDLDKLQSVFPEVIPVQTYMNKIEESYNLPGGYLR